MPIRIINPIFLLCISAVLYGQMRPLGTWKLYMPYGNSTGMVNAGNKIFHACYRSMFSYDKSTGEIRTYDKASGLNDLDIKTIACDPIAKTLAIAYVNGNIDLIENETDIYNINDIKLENSTSTITIHAITFAQGKCYLAHDQGISVLDLNKKEISNTYTIGAGGAPVKVYDVALSQTHIYAATHEGLKRAPLNAPNLQNFNVWSTIQGNGLPVMQCRFVDVSQNKIFTVMRSSATDTVYMYDGNVWKVMYHDVAQVATAAMVEGGIYYFSVHGKNSLVGKNGKITPDGSVSVNVTQGLARPIGWFEEGNVTYEADIWRGFFRTVAGNRENIIPEGPPTSNIHRMVYDNGRLFIAPGSVNDSWLGLYNRDGLMVYDRERWYNRNEKSDANLQKYTDIVSVAASPYNGKTYFGSFYGGLIEYDPVTTQLITYDTANNKLEFDLGSPGAIKISAMTTDHRGNVWMCNSGAPHGIKMIRPNGDWYKFNVPITYETMKYILVDRNDQLWASLRNAPGGIMVWSYNGTLSNTSDDKVKILGTGEGNGNLPDNITYCIAEDLDGNIWVGTNKGIATFYCPGSIFSNNGCDADLIKVERDGYIGYLFGNESVRAIAVDAANRKWVGTTNGLWLISPDGKKEILKFTTENSPLPSNQIADIVIDHKTGEVFIGTVAGLASYQGDAQGPCEDCDEAIVYPNPVKPDYRGPIAIKGLADQAYVKITDISGNLIYQGKANGSQMIWDGNNYKGERAASGVYLVFSSTDLGKERRVAKILFMN